MGIFFSFPKRAFRRQTATFRGPDGIRTRDLRRDRAASTPLDCRTVFLLLLSGQASNLRFGSQTPASCRLDDPTLLLSRQGSNLDSSEPKSDVLPNYTTGQ